MGIQFVVRDRIPGRFTGDFEIEAQAIDGADSRSNAAQQAAISAIEKQLQALAASTNSAPSGSARAHALERICQDAAGKLRIQAEYLLGKPHTADTVVAFGSKADANTASDLQAIETQRQSAVTALESPGFLVEEVWRDKERSQTVDLLVEPSQGVPSKEQQELFVAILSTASIFRKTCKNLAEPGNRIIDSLNRWQPRTPLEVPETVLDAYLRKLARIARFGLQNGQVDLARQALAGLREEFVMQQAGRVKNNYVRRLLVVAVGWAATFAAMLAVAYLLAFLGKVTVADRWPLFTSAAIGAAIGTWLSFSIRKVELGFTDLANLETDLLTPFYRVVFVVALTMCVCLLFATGAINLVIGSLKTDVFKSPIATGPDCLISLLVGMLCGISERSLAGAVAGRSETFVSSIGK
jgi:hypothetical protein